MAARRNEISVRVLKNIFHTIFPRDLLCNHSNGDLFTCEDIMFSCESSPGISLVFI